MLLTRFAHHTPTTAGEVTSLLAESGRTGRIHAGGTDLVVQIRAGAVTPEHVIDLSRVPDLDAIEATPEGGLRIGARVTMSAIRGDARITGGVTALAEGAAEVGSHQIQNRATLAGNLCNASPAADTIPSLFVFGAAVHVLGPGGPRVVGVEEFAVGPRATVLEKGEWVTAVEIPPVSPAGSSYVKLGRTPGVDLAIVGVACLVSAAGPRFAFASVGPTVRTAPQADRILAEGQTFTQEVEEAIATEIAPIDDVRASAGYRRAVAPVLARRAWERANDRYRHRG